MAFLKDLLGIRDIKSPVFFKEFSDENSQLKDLENLYEQVKNDKKEKIRKDIINLKMGIEGEKYVAYELKNSYIPMICLHDIRIEHEDNVAQLDFVLITRYFIMILETKKLNGDIRINEQGEFIRIFKNNNGKIYKQEGMYSPIEQNDRHVRIVEDFLKKNKIIRTIPVYSAVVIANPKSIINRCKAPYNIKNNIFKYDQLTQMINKRIKKCKEDELILESKMEKIANFLISNNKKITYNYYKKYDIQDSDLYLKDEQEKVSKETLITPNLQEKKNEEKSGDYNEKALYDKLVKYRYDKSIEENIKAYCIFSNATLEDIIKVRPKTMVELLKVKGIGIDKTRKYGDDILKILL